jgi:chromosome segregation ATPase
MSKSDSTKKAVAISVGTCLLLGILAFEVIRAQNSDKKNSPEEVKTLTILPNHNDSRWHRDLSELEAKITRTQRHLLSRDGALENARMRADRQKIQEKSEYASQLEAKNDALKAELEEGRQKLAELEKTTATLLGTLDAHNQAKSAAEQSWMREQGEYRLLLSQLEEREGALRAAIETRETALSEIQKETSLQLASMQELMAHAMQETQIEQNHSKNLKLVAEALKLELERVEEQLRDHEQTDVNQHRDFALREKSLTDETQKLSSELEQLKSELEAEIAKAEIQQNHSQELEDSLKALIAKTGAKEQEFLEEISKKEASLKTQDDLYTDLTNDMYELRKAHASLKDAHSALNEDHASLHEELAQAQAKTHSLQSGIEAQEHLFSLSAEKGAELEDYLALTLADGAHRAREASQEGHINGVLQRQVAELKEDLEIHHKLAQNIQEAFEKKIADLTELSESLSAEKQEAISYAKRLEFQEPVRDLDREKELEGQLEALAHNFEDLQRASSLLESQMASEQARIVELTHLLEHQEPIRDTSFEEKLHQEIQELSGQLASSSEQLISLQTASQSLIEELQAERKLNHELNRELSYQLENQVPLRDTAKEEALEKELSTLEARLAQKEQLVNELATLHENQLPLHENLKETSQELERQLTLLQFELDFQKQRSSDLTYQLEHQEPVRDLAREQELEKELSALTARLAQEEQLVHELATLHENQLPLHENLKETSQELEKQLALLQSEIESQKQRSAELTYQLEHQEPVRDLAREQELEKQIESLKTELSLAPADALYAEMDHLRQETQREKDRREYDLFQNTQRELSYQEEIRRLEKTLADTQGQRQLKSVTD